MSYEKTVQDKLKSRQLRADEIECRIGAVDNNGFTLLLYKTARTDMSILDEVFGVTGWKCRYEEIKGNLYCSIYIYDKDNSAWIEKQDCGVESAKGDKEKGEASDAFKRAGTKVGIGRELYSAPRIYINNKTSDKRDRFVVKDIQYFNGKITYLTIVNLTRKIGVFKFGSDLSKKDSKK